jgi:hypothetical protein
MSAAPVDTPKAPSALTPGTRRRGSEVGKNAAGRRVFGAAGEAGRLTSFFVFVVTSEALRGLVIRI